jgi:hypothetical protein
MSSPIANWLKALVMERFIDRLSAEETLMLRRIAYKNNPRIEREIGSGGEEAHQAAILDILTIVAEQVTLRELLSLTDTDRLAFCRGRMFAAKNKARTSDPHSVHIEDSDDFTDMRIRSGSKFRKEDNRTSEQKKLDREVAIEASRMPELREWAPFDSPDTNLPDGWGGQNDDAPVPPARHSDPRRAGLNELYLVHKIDGALPDPESSEYETAVSVLGQRVADRYWELKTRQMLSQRHPDRKALSSTERSRLRRWKRQIQDATTRRIYEETCHGRF